MDKLISVITPTYNTNKYDLLKTIKSVLVQSYNGFEYIIIDDGSKIPFAGLDRNVDDYRVKFIQLDANKGVAAARNEAVKQAKGKYIAFLDAGDWWAKDKLKKQLSVFEKYPSCGLVYCSAFFISKNKKKILWARIDDNAYLELMSGQPITGSCSSVVIPKEIFDEVGGFFEDYDIPEDRDLWLRIAQHCSVKYIEEPLTYIIQTSQSRSLNYDKKELTYKKFIYRHEKVLKEKNKLNDAWAHYYWTLGKFYYKRSSYTRFIKYIFQSFLISHKYALGNIYDKYKAYYSKPQNNDLL